MSPKNADIWVVAGPVGAGKTTVSDILLSRLKPAPALLDKDTMYGPFVAAILSESGRPAGEREGEWYDKHIKVHEYAGMTDTAREIRSKGCPVILSGPFTEQIHDAKLWSTWVEQLGGETVRLVWVKTNAETLRQRLEARQSGRDTEKLAKFDDFIAHMQPGAAPPVSHIAIDNRLSASQPLEAQIAAALPAPKPSASPN
jgi:predicted kinase